MYLQELLLREETGGRERYCMYLCFSLFDFFVQTLIKRAKEDAFPKLATILQTISRYLLKMISSILICFHLHLRCKLGVIITLKHFSLFGLMLRVLTVEWALGSYLKKHNL